MRTRGTFQPGQGGRPQGARNKLQAGFLRDLAEAWEGGGKAALQVMLKEEPSRFVQVCASLMPKEVALDVGGPLAELTDEELREVLQAVKELRARTIEATTREEFERANSQIVDTDYQEAESVPETKLIGTEAKPTEPEAKPVRYAAHNRGRNG